MSNPMTPTEQDKELREKINHRFDSVCAEGHQQSCGEYQTAVDDVMQLITADRKRVALEARLEALDHVIDLQDKQFSRWTQMDIANFFNGVGKYYRELKAQQEEGK